MNTTLKIPNSFLNVLQKILWYCGWCVLAIVAFNLLSEIHTVYERYELFNQTPTIGLNLDTGFDFFANTGKFAGGIANAFFLLLLSSVLEMTILRSRKNTERTDRFMQVACAGYVISNVFGLISWLKVSVSWRENFMFGVWEALWGTTIYLLGLAFAVIIFVVYRRFSQLTKFESEVI